MRRRVRLGLLVALLVVALSTLAAAALLAIGNWSLQSATEDHAAALAEDLAVGVGARAAALEGEDRLEMLRQAARRSGAELLLWNLGGTPVADATLGRIPVEAIQEALREPSGLTTTALGRVRYRWQTVQNATTPLVLFAFVPAPEATRASTPFVGRLLALTVLFVGVAAAVAWAVHREAAGELAFLSRRVDAMVPAAALAPEPIALRTLDEVGKLTVTFDHLVERLAEATGTGRRSLVEAQSADAERQQFLATVSHELRTPLNAILGFTELLLAEIDGPISDDVRDDLAQVLSSARHLRDLVEDVVSLATLDDVRVNLELQVVDLVPMLEEVVREASASIARRPVAVSLAAPVTLPTAVDPKRLRQAVTNIIGNATKFTEQGSVRVRAEATKSRIIVRVSDTGPGIPEAAQRSLFREFMQVGDERLQRGGTGLGLVIAKRIVELHGGRVRLESRVGAGTTVTLELPIREAAPSDFGPKRRTSRRPRSRRP
jgi:signal transduction histidine kinase